MRSLRIIAILLIALCSGTAYSQTLTTDCKLTSAVISGTYNGRNLYFANNKANAIKEIYLNDEKTSVDMTSPAFEIILSKLKVGQPVMIKIVYCDITPVPYKLLNPEVLK